MADFVQKLDLKTGSFLNNNSAAAGGIEIDTGAGSKVALAIAAAGSGSGTTPDATDTVKGKVALNTGATAGDATNAIDALTAAGFTTLAGATNALSAAISAGAGAVATVAGTGAPTVTPSATAPAQFAKNSSGELFKWNGSAWVLMGGGAANSVGFSPSAAADNVTIAGASMTMPRAGVVLFNTSVTVQATSGSPMNRAVAALRKNGSISAYVFGAESATANMVLLTKAMSIPLAVAAGDVVDLSFIQNGSTQANVTAGYIFSQYIS